MLRLLATLLILANLAPQPAGAGGEKPGEFDYWVLALSWSPNWCALEGDARESEQCGQDFGWVVHGFWPQFESGWPSYCPSLERAPSRSLTAVQADLFGAGGSAWYQWKKHGVCSGLSATNYYRLVREAYGRVNRPGVLRKLDHAVRLPASVIEDAFLAANPGFSADMVTVTCDAGYIQEARICFTRELEPRPCAPDTRRDCSLSNALLEPVK